VALEVTMERVSSDVARGDLGKARDRLEGLLAAYPDDLEIRRRLGDLYWRLQYPERAGRHWYLIESERPEMDVAKRAFESRYGGDAWLMLDAIGYHGGLDSLEGTYGDAVIRDLAQRAGVSPGKLEAALRRRNPNEPVPPTPESWRSKLFVWSLLGVVVVVLVLAVVGLFAAFGALARLF